MGNIRQFYGQDIHTHTHKKKNKRAKERRTVHVFLTRNSTVSLNLKEKFILQYYKIIIKRKMNCIALTMANSFSHLMMIVVNKISKEEESLVSYTALDRHMIK